MKIEIFQNETDKWGVGDQVLVCSVAANGKVLLRKCFHANLSMRLTAIENAKRWISSAPDVLTLTFTDFNVYSVKSSVVAATALFNWLERILFAEGINTYLPALEISQSLTPHILWWEGGPEGWAFHLIKRCSKMTNYHFELSSQYGNDLQFYPRKIR